MNFKDYEKTIEKIDKIDKIFSNLNNLIYSYLNDPDPEKKLTDTYFYFWKQLKKNIGTASNFTGLSEYLFFTYAKMYIESKLKITFKHEELTDFTYKFCSKDLVITHDVNISQFNKSLPKQRTDIALFKKKGRTYYLLCAFQIKIYLPSIKSLEDDIRKLEELKECSSAILFEIILLDPSIKSTTLLNEFCNEKLPGRAYLISQFKCGCNIQLNKALDMIIDKYKEEK